MMKVVRILGLLIWAVLAAPVFAQSDLVLQYRASADACRESADPAHALETCENLVAQSCMENEQGGWSNQGMALCTQAEHRYWDEVLNLEYQRTIATLERGDAADRGMGQPEYAVRVERLRAAQRAWIEFRDAECALAYAQWGMGSMRLLAGAGCLSDMTFRRVVDLIRLRENHE